MWFWKSMNKYFSIVHNWIHTIIGVQELFKFRGNILCIWLFIDLFRLKFKYSCSSHVHKWSYFYVDVFLSEWPHQIYSVRVGGLVSSFESPPIIWRTTLNNEWEMSIDEAMVTYTGRLIFKQFIQNKPRTNRPVDISIDCNFYKEPLCKGHRFTFPINLIL